MKTMHCGHDIMRVLCAAAGIGFLACLNSDAKPLEYRGAQFVPFKSFARFTKSDGASPGELALTSPEIHSHIQWNELIASWNIEMPTNTSLKVEVRAIYSGQATKGEFRPRNRSADGPRPQHYEQPLDAEVFQRSFNHPHAASRDGSRATKFYTMGLWSADPAQHPRESVPNQKDADGDVLTDTLVLNKPAGRFQLRVTLGGSDRKKPKLKFLGVSLLDSTASPPSVHEPTHPQPLQGGEQNSPARRDTTPVPLLGGDRGGFTETTSAASSASNHAAWGKIIPVPERSQMAYENGKALCSPTTVSMLLAYWSAKLKRPELDRDVPEISEGVFDPNWPGTGNWAFNMAYAGSFRGLRAYVTRLSDVSELEDWIARGIPVGLSVCYNRLRGKSREPSGHVVVCCGFTENGDAIINDPGTSQNVQKVFPRANLIDAWSYSKNTVYLVYPTNTELPKDRFGHWDSR
jgi:hypothetical protein